MARRLTTHEQTGLRLLSEGHVPQPDGSWSDEPHYRVMSFGSAVNPDHVISYRTLDRTTMQPLTELWRIWRDGRVEQY